jgi:hypothetical protein
MKKIHILMGFLITSTTYGQVIPLKEKTDPNGQPISFDPKKEYLLEFNNETLKCPLESNAFKCVAIDNKKGTRAILRLGTNGYRIKIQAADNQLYSCGGYTNTSVSDCLNLHGVNLTGALHGKYTACNNWLKRTYPEDKMIQINDDGSITAGPNASQYFNTSEDGKQIEASMIKRNPENKKLNIELDIRVQKLDDGSMEIERLSNNQFLMARYNNYDNSMYKNYYNPSYQSVNYQQTIAQQVTALYNQSLTAWSQKAVTNVPADKTSVVKAHLKLGSNGKCYVEEVVENSNKVNQWGEDIQVASSKKCHDILKFQEENPGLANCTNPKVFEKLNNLLGNPVQSTSEYRFPGQISVGIPNQDFKSVSVSERFERAMSLPQQLLSQAKSEIDSCDKFNLAGFAQDKALFKELKTGKSPASSNQTTSTSIKE